MRRGVLLALGIWLMPLGMLAQGPLTSTSRLSPVPDAQRTPEQKTIVEQYGSLGMPNFVATLLHYPQLTRLLPHVHLRHQPIRASAPPSRAARPADRLADAFGVSLGASRAAARADGLTDDEITRVARGPDTSGWDPFDAAVLRAADELHIDSFISDATWKTLSARYDVNQMVDTIDTVGALTMHAGVMNTAGVQVEADVKDRLPSLPFSVAAKRTNIRLEGRGARIPPQEAAGGRGGGGNVFRTFNRNPTADRTRGAMNTQVNSTNSLQPRQRELLLMRIGVLCRSEYEYAAHHRAGRQAGLTEADVARILAGPDSAGGDPLDTALLRAADELFENDVVSSNTWAALAKGGSTPGNCSTSSLP